jgi:hypothetical protein
MTDAKSSGCVTEVGMAYKRCIEMTESARLHLPSSRVPYRGSGVHLIPRTFLRMCMRCSGEGLINMALMPVLPSAIAI